MSLIKHLRKEQFKDPLVADAVESLLKLEQRFIDLNQGNVLGGHLISIASTFRDENKVINELLTMSNPGRNRSNTRVVRMKSRPRRSNGDVYDEQGNCLTCEKSTVSPKSSVKGLEPPDDETELQGAPDSLESLAKKVKTWRDVANVFDTDIDVMKVFMNMNSITVGQTKSETSLAKKIFNKLKDEGLIE